MLVKSETQIFGKAGPSTEAKSGYWMHEASLQLVWLKKCRKLDQEMQILNHEVPKGL